MQSLGVHFGAFSLYLPRLWRPETRAFGEIFATLSAPGWRPSLEELTPLPVPPPPHESLVLRGLREVAGFAAPVLALERLGAMARAAEAPDGGFEVSPEVLAALGWTAPQTEAILRALGHTKIRNGSEAIASVWRRRSAPQEQQETSRRRPRRKRPGQALAKEAIPS
jgi:hypothetical protein